MNRPDAGKRRGPPVQGRAEQTATASLHGRFLWYELMTTDIAGAKAFYCSVMGWRALDASMFGTAYTLFKIGEDSVSGLMALPQQSRQMGVQPRWIGYIGVNDVDAATERIKQLGGAVDAPPTEVPNISRFCVVTDPEKVTIALFKWLQAGQGQPTALRTPGRVGWHELLTADCDKAWAFYRDIFGWQKGVAESGVMGTYQLFSAAGQTIGAISTKPSAAAVAFWLYYFNVGDVDGAAHRVKSGGGQVLNGPIEVPDGSWIVQCMDPQGAMFALVGKRSYRAVGFLERVSGQIQT